MTKKEEILSFFKLRENIEQTVKEYVQDKSIPLDDRWEIFEKSECGLCKSFVANLDSLNRDIVCYDGLVHVDRNQTVSVFDILEQYESGEDTSKWEMYNFDPVAFQEECLSKFLKGWKYDW